MENSNLEKDQLFLAAVPYVAELNLQHQDARRIFHDIRLSTFLAEEVQAIGEAENNTAEDIRAARLAALFYPLGYRIETKPALQAAQEAASIFLSERNESANYSELVAQCLKEVYNKRPLQPAASLLHDALIGTYCNTEVYEWANLRNLEGSLIDGPTSRLSQAQLQLQALLGIRYATRAGQARWQKAVGQQMLEQKRKVEKLLRDSDRKEVPEAGKKEEEVFLIEDGIPVRAAQTYFRAVYRNHINLSAIADNKANIMISVNSILISVLITFLSYRNIAETQPMILLPVVIFLVTGLASLIFAVLSARPKVTKQEATLEAGGNKKGLAFFGNFVQLTLPDFEAAMDLQLQKSQLLYGSMVEDLYHLGKVLDKKYRYLTISYNIFMVGLIVTVGLFLITLFAN